MSVEAVYEEMKDKLAKIVPDVELRIKAELVHQIRRLKEEKSVVRCPYPEGGGIVGIVFMVGIALWLRPY